MKDRSASAAALQPVFYGSLEIVSGCVWPKIIAQRLQQPRGWQLYRCVCVGLAVWLGAPPSNGPQSHSHNNHDHDQRGCSDRQLARQRLLKPHAVLLAPVSLALVLLAPVSTLIVKHGFPLLR
jgi:hypothetical protein